MEIVLLLFLFYLLCGLWSFIIWLFKRGWRVPRVKRVRKPHPNDWMKGVKYKTMDEIDLEQAKRWRDMTLGQRFKRSVVIRQMFGDRNREVSDAFDKANQEILDQEVDKK